MLRRLHLALFAGVVFACKTASPPLDESLFKPCTREHPTPDDWVFKCGARVVNFATVARSDPAALEEQLIQGLGEDAGKIERTSVEISSGGAKIPARQFVAKDASGAPTFASYFAVQPTSDGRTRFVHCVAVHADPEAFEACKGTIAYLFAKGAPDAQREKGPMERLEALLNHKVALADDCSVAEGHDPTGGAVRCGDRFILRWDASTDGSAQVERFAGGLAAEFAAKGWQPVRDAPKCRVFKSEGVCARLHIVMDIGPFTFFIGSADQRFVMCSARDGEEAMMSLCTEIFTIL